MDQVQLVKAAKAALQVREDRRYQMQAWRESVVAKLNTGAEVGEARAKRQERKLFIQPLGAACTRSGG